jgi:putative transposase
MPRANRYFVSGRLWHITHRCHEREFLLKFARDRRAYLRWLFEAKKRFGLCVLNYVVTSNHIHLLISDTGEGIIARSMQLIAGCTAQDYNRRKARQGAFWEDRYHATAVDADAHFKRCLVYVDLNMVRAGAVAHPREWEASGYREIQAPPKRYGVIDIAALSALCGFSDIAQFQEAHQQWVESALEDSASVRDPCWSEAIAVGGRSFVEAIQHELGVKARYRDVREADGTYTLREPMIPYLHGFDKENEPLSGNNRLFWQGSLEITES